ncbi:MAG: PIN domain nuclease, partial [Actinobacteria bacterium]|nr:PIN domain nuclease [Actinomycetota bacterium]
MRFDIVLIRLVFTVILLAAGYVLHPIPGHRLISTAVAGFVAVAIIFFEMRIRRSSLKTLIGAAVGSILGIIGAYLIGSLISSQESLAVPPTTKTFLTLALTFFMAYV